MRLNLLSQLCLLVFAVTLTFTSSSLMSGAALATPVFAQSAVETTDEPQAVVSAREAVQVSKNIIFNATRSYNPTPERPVVYAWSFGDGTFDTGEEVVHVFRRPGVYEVTLEMQVGGARSTITFPVFAYTSAVLLVSDDPSKVDTLTALEEAAQTEGILLAVARGFGTNLTSEGALAVALQEQVEILPDADLIILWTQGSGGLSSLTQFAQEQPDIDFHSQRVAVISTGSLSNLASIARGAFAALQSAEIIITRADAVRELVLRGYTADTASVLTQELIPFEIVDSGITEFNPLRSLSFATSYLLSRGVPASVILLILMLPVIATLVAFLKQVVGITTFGVYTPAVVTLSFLMLGLKVGLVVLFVVLAASVVMRRILRRYRLSYTPRMAIVLTGVALAVLAAVLGLVWLTPLGETGIESLVFPILIIGTLAERFVSVQSEKGTYSALRLTVEVTGVAIVCYIIVGKWVAFRTLMLAVPELVFVFLIFDILLGRYTGLRITEYVRFKDVIKKTEEE